MKKSRKRFIGAKKAVGRVLTGILSVSLLLSLSLLPALAQTETGQIVVKVTDPQGAVVTGATVNVKSVDTGRNIPTNTTGGEGIATIPNLQPGLYEVAVSSSGFTETTRRVNVTTGGKVTVEVPLSVGGISGEVVTVVAGEGGVEVNTQTQELSNVVSTTQIRELPTITRNPYSLVGISGNVSPADPSGRGAGGFAINGQRAASTNILLDGGENVDTFTATVGQSVPLDSVQEFRVITSNFSAEYGRASGGIVNVTTRAGTNDFHGTAYEFNRVAALASNGFDNNAQELEKGGFTRNQFGYSLGGRIIKDKLFFFSSTEWIRVRSSASVINLVPTPQLIAASAPATRNFFAQFPLATPINGDVFTVGQVAAELGVGAGAFANLPANLPAFGEVRYNVPNDTGAGSPQDSYQTVGRVDWNVSDATQLYGRYALENQNFFIGSNASSPYAGFNTGADARNQNFLLSLTHSFSPRFVSQSKIVFNRLNGSQPLGEQPPQPTLYLRSSVATRLRGNLVALPGYLPFNPGSAIPFGGPQNFTQLYEDINYTAGKHQLRFGGQYVHIQDNRTFGAYQNSVASLSTTSSTQGLNNLVLGQLRRFQVAIDAQGHFFPGETINLPVSFPNFSRSNRYNEWALYFNDAWRVRPGITLNLGVRYEYYGVQHNKDQNLDSNFYLGSGSTIQERIASGRVFLAQDSPVGSLWAPDKNNFAPRLGFAWDVFGDGKTSLRGGYGIAYERNFGNVTFNVIQNPPNYAVVTIESGGSFGTLPLPSSNFGPLAGGSGSITLPGQLNVRHVAEDIVNAYAHFWSAAFEREISPNTLASVEYSGSAGRSLYDLTNDNRIGSAQVFFGAPAPLTPEAAAAGNPLSLLNPNYRPLNTRGNKGRSNYNALILGLESSKLRNYGLQFTARYTYSVTRDNLSSTFSESNNNFNLGLLDPFDPDLDYGYADFDVRHRFTGSFNWNIGGSRHYDNAVFNQVLGGWTLAGIFTARTGSPFSVFDCTNAQFEVCPRLVPSGSFSFSGSDNPSQVPGEGGAPAPANRFRFIDLSNQTPGNFINPLTGNSEFGPFPSDMTRRNAFRGPGFWNLDGAVYKNFKIGETKSLQFRSEFYNVFNHANLEVVGGDADISSFDFVPARRTGRRQIQLALKFIF